jgi:hypothetical protein
MGGIEVQSPRLRRDHWRRNLLPLLTATTKIGADAFHHAEVGEDRRPPRHAAHGHLDDNHGASADQVSAGHVDVDCPISHRRDDVLAGTGCAGVCA